LFLMDATAFAAGREELGDEAERQGGDAAHGILRAKFLILFMVTGGRVVAPGSFTPRSPPPAPQPVNCSQMQ
jgi:hypothetical protein